MSRVEVDAVVRNLIARRHGLSLSQREVARRAGISNGALSEIEAGKHSPTLSTLRAWARVLDRDVVLTHGVARDALDQIGWDDHGNLYLPDRFAYIGVAMDRRDAAEEIQRAFDMARLARRPNEGADQ